MKTKGWTILCVILACFGLFVVVFAAVFQIVFNYVFDKELKEKLSLKTGTVAYDRWIKPPVPVEFGVYVFDVKNAKQVIQGLEQPLVQEKGPFVYRMSLHKTIIDRFDWNDSITFRQPQAYTFDRDASVGPMTDTFTAPNIPLMAMAQTMHKWPWYVQKAMNLLMEVEKETAFKNLTINDIFWGYEDPFLHKAYELLAKFGIHIPYIQSKFGFFAGKNNSDDGIYNILTGVNGDLSTYCEINTWNGLEHLNVWNSKRANAIYGTTGSMHPPYVESDSKLAIFDGYLQRSLDLKYVGPSSYKGLDTLRFVVPFSQFANATDNPDMAGFCTPDCIPSGCINLTVVSYGAPFFISLPHFVGGDPYYEHLVHGLHPNPAKHQPFYNIHALTGVTITGSRRYQINIRTESYEYFKELQHFPVSYLPVIWIDGMSTMDDDNLSEFRDGIQKLVRAVPKIRGGLFGAGALILLVSMCLAVYRYRKVKQMRKREMAQSLLDDSQEIKGPSLQEEGTSKHLQTERDPLLGKI